MFDRRFAVVIVVLALIGAAAAGALIWFIREMVMALEESGLLDVMVGRR